MSPLRDALVLALFSSLLFLGSPVRADDAAVGDRLSKHGGLSGGAAKRLISKVAQRMNKSAPMLARDSDPLRVALSQALFRRPVPGDTLGEAKVRLRLYAGLSEWALEALFAPKPGAVTACVRDFGATQGECEALVAAAGRMTLADARNASAGSSAPTSVAAAPTQAAPAPTGSRFGRFNSGFAPQPKPAAAAPSNQSSFASSRPAAARPAAPPARAPAQPAMSQKEAYRLRREAYLARQKAQHEERKQALAGGAATPSAAPAADAPAAKAAPIASKAPTKSEAPVVADEPAADAPKVAKAAPAEKPALDGDFLDGLLSDPLGGK